ncbi:hypothetical protein LVJ94_16040 [Pendulispora rubella]|uniref:Uncharacterized protein n=1 Tax=Pendulispora rubella TaxID=2741070 RepID=A0ABZ2LCT4_9BACT
MTEFAKYVKIREQGFVAADAYRIARVDGLSVIESIRMLRAVFALSLSDAKEVTIVASGTASNIAEHEARIASKLGGGKNE